MGKLQELKENRQMNIKALVNQFNRLELTEKFLTARKNLIEMKETGVATEVELAQETLLQLKAAKKIADNSAVKKVKVVISHPKTEEIIDQFHVYDSDSVPEDLWDDMDWESDSLDWDDAKDRLSEALGVKYED